MSAILAFYHGTAEGPAGRRIQDVWAYGARDLERRHDFIQWLFPLREGSRYNPDAPMLSPADEAAFRDDPALRQRLLHSLDLMLAFYGLRRDGECVVPADPDSIGQAAWLRPCDHNHLRLSRIVQSLALLGCRPEAEAVKACLLALTAEHPGGFAPETVAIWSGLPVGQPPA